MKIIAHRGLWCEVSDKNTPLAFSKALNERFGIETDFRDCMGKLVVSHNPPTGGCMSAEDFFTLCSTVTPEIIFALNVKADGLQDLFVSLLKKNEIRYFLFDMSVPDARGYIENGLTVFTRQSEYEMQSSFYEDAHGVWIDSFLEDSWIDQKLIMNHIYAGKKVCLVSPELHDRDYQDLWNTLAELPRDVISDLMLCTDHPNKARSFFSE